MPAYAVKHLVADHGPLSKIMKDVKRTPYSYTSKKPEATDAARGSDVYVIQVEARGSTRSYSLGYKYRATESYTLAGGGLWNGEFKFKNSATPGVGAIGFYFDPPLPINNVTVRQWLAGKQPGMAEIPVAVLNELEALAAASSVLAVAF